MAVLPDTQVRDLFRDDGPRRICLLSVTGVTTGDTLDLGPRFTKLLNCVAVSMTSNAQFLPTQNGVVVTFQQVGLVNDTLVLLVVGGWV